MQKQQRDYRVRFEELDTFLESGDRPETVDVVWEYGPVVVYKPTANKRRLISLVDHSDSKCSSTVLEKMEAVGYDMKSYYPPIPLLKIPGVAQFQLEGAPDG